MNHEERDRQRQQTADFRYSLVGELCNPYLTDRERKRLIKEKTGRLYVIPRSDKNKITAATIRTWMIKCMVYGKEGLLSDKREDKGHSRFLTDDEANRVVTLIKQNPSWTATFAVRKLYEDGLIKTEIKDSALSRLLKANGLTLKQRIKIIEDENNKDCKTQIEKDWLHRLLQGQITENNLIQELHFKLAPLPTCAQFLNVIESVFSGMSRAIIHNSNYQSVEECKTAINTYFKERNENFKLNPKRAGKKIWGKERVKAEFSESNNCKDPLY